MSSFLGGKSRGAFLATGVFLGGKSRDHRRFSFKSLILFSKTVVRQ